MKAGAPLVSVVIPCYNLGQYLPEAVASVKKQSFTAWELIVVDDGSTDALTIKVLKQLEAEKIKVVRIKNSSAANARNVGIREARSKYICCLDADDKLGREFLSKTVPILQKDQQKKIGIVAPDYQFFGTAHGYQRVADFDPVALAVANTLQAASLFRRECWQKVEGYSLNLRGYEDWDFWLKIVAAGYRWVCIHEPLIYYRRRRDSKVNTSQKNHVMLTHTIVDNNADFYRRHDLAIIKLLFIAQNDLLHSKLARVREWYARFKRRCHLAKL